MNIKDIKPKIALIGSGVALIAIALIWMFSSRLEGTRPTVDLDPSLFTLGVSSDITVTVTDVKTGLRKARVALFKDGKETILLEKDYPAPGFVGTGRIKHDSLTIRVEPKKLGLRDGKASLRLAVWDHSWRNWTHGNKTDVEKDIIIDTAPPRIRVLTRFHNIAQGGAALVIYSLNEPCPQTGVFVGDNFFPGYSGHFRDKNIHMAFFALDYSQSPDSRFYIKATDTAGNSAQSGFPHYVRKRSFKKDVITLSDSFLNWKMPELEIPGDRNTNLSPVEKFLKVNRELRRINREQLKKATHRTEPALLWHGGFQRLPNSAPRAGFADHRAYKYKGRIIDNQVHMGVDLASTAQAPIPAANQGKIVFADDLGIYGLTVIIDHGFGLFSMYSHLSNSEIQVGDDVQRGSIIGNTGVTGLAGGDHLHYGMLIHHTFVDPIEWWDTAWIKNNITDKISMVQTTLSGE